nr:MAG TPA: minor tail protein [Caudoviricetes sp.]
MAGGYDGEIRIRTLIENGDASSSLLQLESRFQKLTRESQRLTDQMRQMERQKIPTDQYKDLQNTFDSLVANGRQLSEKLKNTEKYVPTRAYKEAEAALDRVSGRQAQLNHRMQEWVALGRNTDSVSYRKMQMEMADCERESDRLIDALNRMEEAGQDRQINDKWKDLKNQMRQVGQEAAQIRAEMMRMENENAAYIDPRNTEEYQRLAARLREVNEQLDIMNQRMREVVDREDEMDTSAGGRFGNIQGAVQQVNGAIEKFIKRVKKIALTILVFQFVSKAFRTMIEGIKTGIQNYARYSEQFNQKMSEMKSATLNLKNSIGAAAIPIVNALAPALTVLCSWLTKAINLFNKFISALSGKKTWTRAKEQQVDYAASLDNTANAAKKAKGALQGFDELNVINSNDSGSSGGGSGGSGGGVDYEEVPLTEKDFAWIEKIKKIFESILPVVVAIGAALLAWKIASFLSDLMKVHPILGTILSILAIIAGLALAIYSYFHMWNEGVDWQGLIGYILGVSLAFGGLYALFGPLVAGIFLIIASAAGLILALKDISENGLNAKNASLLLVSALGLCAGVFMVFGTTAAFVVAGLLLISAGIADVIQKGVTLKNGLLIVAGVFLSVSAVAGAVIGAIAALVAGLVLAVIADWENFKKTVWEPMKKWFAELWSDFTQITNGFKKMLDGLTLFVNGVFSGDWKKAWEGIKETFGGAWDGIVGLLKASANLIIGILNTVYNFVCGVVNAIINGINKISFTTPDWLNYLHEGWGGQSFGGFNLQPIQPINIPYLANGGITTGSTLANIGEAGREAVLPLENNLSYMKPLAEMIASEMKGVQTVRIVADEGKIFKIVKEEADDYYRRTGSPAFDF